MDQQVARHATDHGTLDRASPPFCNKSHQAIRELLHTKGLDAAYDYVTERFKAGAKSYQEQFQKLTGPQQISVINTELEHRKGNISDLMLLSLILQGKYSLPVQMAALDELVMLRYDAALIECAQIARNSNSPALRRAMLRHLSPVVREGAQFSWLTPIIDTVHVKLGPAPESQQNIFKYISPTGRLTIEHPHQVAPCVCALLEAEYANDPFLSLMVFNLLPDLQVNPQSLLDIEQSYSLIRWFHQRSASNGRILADFAKHQGESYALRTATELLLGDYSDERKAGAASFIVHHCDDPKVFDVFAYCVSWSESKHVRELLISLGSEAIEPSAICNPPAEVIDELLKNQDLPLPLRVKLLDANLQSERFSTSQIIGLIATGTAPNLLPHYIKSLLSRQSEQLAAEALIKLACDKGVEREMRIEILTKLTSETLLANDSTWGRNIGAIARLCEDEEISIPAQLLVGGDKSAKVMPSGIATVSIGSDPKGFSVEVIGNWLSALGSIVSRPENRDVPSPLAALLLSRLDPYLWKLEEDEELCAEIIGGQSQYFDSFLERLIGIAQCGGDQAGTALHLYCLLASRQNRNDLVAALISNPEFYAHPAMSSKLSQLRIVYG